MPKPRSITILCRTAVLAAVLAVAGCSSDGDGGSGDGGSGDGETAAGERPDGPAADLSEELTGGDGVSLIDAAGTSALEEAGWVQHEYVAAGTASSYRSEGELPADGRFELVEDGSAGYRTRVVVRRPESPDAFNGTVVVEWLNVSAGFDADPDHVYMADELRRGGYAWVGVSAQVIGIEGGDVAVATEAGGDLAGRGLRALDPERYGSLEHPGDAFAYDIFTQVARALRAEGSSGALGDLEPQRIIAAGESQSAFMLTTYINGVQPRIRAFDGFLVHSRGGSAAPLGSPGEGIDIASTIGLPPTIIRTDGDVPVMILESETDVTSVINYYPARQDDSELIRLWEMAGTAHADRYITGTVSDSFDCGVPINAGPQHYVVKAALRSLDTWIRSGEPPPEAPRLEVDDRGEAPAIRRDADGIALGGIRTPHVDVPVDVLSGEPGPSSSVICLLLGSTRPLPEARLAELYRSREAYLEAFEQATDAAIDAGFILEDDRETVLADAQPDRFPG
jgi:hypothetical protein